ncbi:MAG TPA: DUF805 domain-containing protein [Cytophagales bacterium]|jgi:uncharacterized membrane protein YhaH (DUF805 family)|nr:DUF805 domain-containing protein [Cytophagales bacterium]
MFKRPFSFDGRIRRMEYGISFIIYMVVYFFTALLTTTGDGTGALIMVVLWIPLVWFLIAQGTKRCHDVGRNGWWQIIPFYGLALLFIDGDRERNEYGSNPKFPEDVDVLGSETLDGHLKS